MKGPARMTGQITAMVAAPVVAVAVIAAALLSGNSLGTGSLPGLGKPPPALGVSCGHEAKPAVYVGIAPGPQWEQEAARFSAAGVRPGILEFYQGFGEPFDASRYCRVTRYGALPLIQVDPRHVTLTSIASGARDHWIRAYARAVRNFREPVAISFAHEMNGRWEPWSPPYATPAQFVAAWRRIVTIFRAQHVSNVIWTWGIDRGGASVAPWWPGRKYVNWVGIDGYLRPGQTFSGIFNRRLADVRQITDDPIILAEMAAAPGPARPGQMRQAFTGVLTDRLRGLIWFNIDARERWRIDDDPVALAALGAASKLVRPVTPLG